MIKIIWLVVALVVGGFLYHIHLENNAKREAERVEQERIENEVRISIQELISRTNAVEDWASRLSGGESYRFEPILTVELERLWLVERPILFVGSIKDIKSHDKANYEVLIERDFLSNLGSMFSTDLQLSLIAQKAQVDAFLEKHPPERIQF